jgi:biotin operon repressor
MTKKILLEQSELLKTDIGWFHIFKELIRNKTWAKLSSNSRSLYPVIKAYANHKNGEAFPSIDTLQEFSGLARASVMKALKELETEGLLVKSGAAGRHNNYSLIEKFEVTDLDGRPTASVSFDYMPALVGDAVAELKNFMAKGLTIPDGKTQFIKIENLTLNITQNIVDKQINSSDIGATELAKIQALLRKKKD